MKRLIISLIYLLIPAVLLAENRTMEVSFNSGKLTLKGKLITAAPEGRKVPAIIFCVGSKASSYETGYRSFLRYFFEQNLPLDSVALLYFEKRGVGHSEGSWAKTDFEERAADVAAAAEFLKTQPFVDPKKIIVAGHSQGGWIAQICAARYPEIFAAGISLAGPPFTVRKQVINDLASKFRCAGLDSLKALRKAESQTSQVFMLARVFPINRSLRQLKVIRKFNPAEYLQQITTPFLFLFGDQDPLVDIHWAQQELKNTFPRGLPEHFQIREIQGANHSFRLSDPCNPGVGYAEEAKEALNQWFHKFLST